MTWFVCYNNSVICVQNVLPTLSDRHPPSPVLSFYPAEDIREGCKWQLSILELCIKNKSLRQGLTGLRTGRGLFVCSVCISLSQLGTLSCFAFPGSWKGKSWAKLFSPSKVKRNVSLWCVRERCYEQRSQWKVTTSLSKFAMGPAAEVRWSRTTSAPCVWNGCSAHTKSMSSVGKFWLLWNVWNHYDLHW